MMHIPQQVQDIVDALHDTGGHCYLVGGFVRDYTLGIPSKDIDIEIHNLETVPVVDTLRTFGKVDLVGAFFGVYRLQGLDVDWSLPRTEVSMGVGHCKFAINVDSYLGIERALRRRDFTVNAIAYSLKEGILVDPFRGDIDLHDGVLRHVDDYTFVEDPLRVLRGAQFCARLGLSPTPETTALCRSMVDQYGSLTPERVWGELKKLLLKGSRPSLGLRFLRDVGWLAHFPELDVLFDTPQDPRHHPEGDVGVHTCEVIDRAADLRYGIPEKDRLVYMLACLLHDVGKPSTTVQAEDGTITAHGHDKAGVEGARAFLKRVTNEEDVIDRVCALVEDHMFPHFSLKAKAPAFRRLKKRVDTSLLGKVAEADGDRGDGCLDRYYAMLDSVGEIQPGKNKATIVQGRHLIARGFKPSPQFGEIIRECEDYFLETGIRDHEEILDHVLKEGR